MKSIPPVSSGTTSPCPPERSPKQTALSFKTLLPPASFAESFSPPSPNDPQELQDAWAAAQQFETMVWTRTIEQLYESSEPNPDNQMLTTQLAQAFSEGISETGTHVAGDSIARHVYEDMKRTIQKGDNVHASVDELRHAIDGA